MCKQHKDGKGGSDPVKKKVRDYQEHLNVNVFENLDRDQTLENCNLLYLDQDENRNTK
jgi:hypothetical protein